MLLCLLILLPRMYIFVCPYSFLKSNSSSWPHLWNHMAKYQFYKFSSSNSHLSIFYVWDDTSWSTGDPALSPLMHQVLLVTAVQGWAYNLSSKSQSEPEIWFIHLTWTWKIVGKNNCNYLVILWYCKWNQYSM